MPIYGGGGIAKEDTGALNTEVGSTAQPSITTGVNNTAVGYNANNSLTTGANNSAFGTGSLQSNTTSSYNTGIGENALHFVDGAGVALAGDANTGIGYFSLRNVTSGQRNTAVGVNSGISATTSSNLTFLGYGADLGVADAGGLSFVTVIGAGAVNNVSNSVAIGRSGLDIVSLGGKQGNESFRATPIANQVNRIDVYGSIAGVSPRVEADGADANLNLQLVPKGTGFAEVTLNGMKFPNVNNADVNAMDYYGEGTFTPSLFAIGCTFNYAFQLGYYTRIGNRVLFYIDLQLAGSGNVLAANAVIMLGLPFAGNAGAGTIAQPAAQFAGFTTALIALNSEVQSTNLNLFKQTVAATTNMTTALVGTDLHATAGSHIRINGQYFI